MAEESWNWDLHSGNRNHAAITMHVNGTVGSWGGEAMCHMRVTHPRQATHADL